METQQTSDKRDSKESLPPRTFKNAFWGLPGILAVAVVILDQATKILVNANWPVGYSTPVLEEFFHLVHWRNTGAAWGMFAEHTWILGAFSTICFVALVWKFDAVTERKTISATLFGILAGGIFGNMLDRVFRQSVIDFLDFHWHDAHFPAFNVADIAISCSIILLLVWSIWNAYSSKQSSSEPSETV